MVANGEDFEDAARSLRAEPSLDVGLHLTFVAERPLSSPVEVPTLVGRDGRFLPDHGRFLRRWFQGRISLREVELEARRQLARVRDVGLTITHLDSHQHLHALPPIFDVVAALAAEHGIPYVRLPRDAHGVPTRLDRWLGVRGLARMSDRDRGRVPAGVRVNDRTIGVMDAGRLGLRRLLALLERVEGVTELVAHPGEGDTAIASRYRWGYRWDAEREALCDPRVRERMAALGITLGGVRDLPPA